MYIDVHKYPDWTSSVFGSILVWSYCKSKIAIVIWIASIRCAVAFLRLWLTSKGCDNDRITKDNMATEAKTEEAPAAAEPTKEVRNVILTGFGGIKTVKTQMKPQVSAKEGEVVIRVKACGLNFVDLMVGDRVIGFCDTGAWAEVVAIPSQSVYKIPDNMTFQDGAALTMNYLTAYIHAGQAIAQLAKTVEDVKIFGTASYYKHDSVKDSVTHLFDRVIDYAQEVRKLSPEGVDIVLDCMCGDDTNKGIALLKPMGKYVLYGSSNIVTGETKSFFSFAKSWWQVDKISPIKLYDENKSIAGFQLRHLVFKQGQYGYVKNVMNSLIQLYNAGKIRPIIDSAWAFEDAGDAMQKLHDRKNVGKIILDPSLQPKPKPAKQQDRQHTNSTCSDGEKEKKESAIRQQQ
ncbi:hypothetical protein KUTeg_019658 [Tegillarca granosa]|uniref:Enoyl reductase (ER) domain-containing protein n=1 Tax=Tegillarca granosa TaxID=220873 RepID=A0ABQ9ED86_TEGGR|nr:hypothetical protein KUTeg_019658 [Tegillarca granosa]